ncbi:hypothetical protein GCM10017788_28640 [Amycolatopsis acidiphila]|nr:hypothetical protein GCM10017788_28640 [Amycolatopsis acidiphila]
MSANTYYSVRTAAWILGVPPSHISRAIRRGTLRPTWRNGRPLVPESAVTRLLGQPDREIA